MIMLVKQMVVADCILLRESLLGYVGRSEVLKISVITGARSRSLFKTINLVFCLSSRFKTVERYC